MNSVYGVLGFFGYRTFVEQRVTSRLYVAGKDIKNNINNGILVVRDNALTERHFSIDGSKVTEAQFRMAQLKYMPKEDQEEPIEGSYQVIDPVVKKKIPLPGLVKRTYLPTTAKISNLNDWMHLDDSDLEEDSDDEYVNPYDRRNNLQRLNQVDREISLEDTVNRFVEKGYGEFRHKVKVETTSSHYMDYRRFIKVILSIATISLAIFAFLRFNGLNHLKNRFKA
jgi:hypothetical protein